MVDFILELCDENVETVFDDCRRAWDITAGDINSSLKKPDFQRLDQANLALNQYIHLANDQTSIVAESCGKDQQNIAHIYWVPGAIITNQASLNEYYNKKAVRVISLNDDSASQEDFAKLVQNLANSVTIKP